MTTVAAPDPTTDPDLYSVTQLNGHPLAVQSAEEQAFYTALQHGYQQDNVFKDASDKADLDRLMSYELQVFRMNHFLAAGCDYDGKQLGLSHLTEMRRQAKELAALIREVKTDLGLSRAARTAEQAESVGAYIVELKKRAKEMGVKRSEEVKRALILTHELISLVETYDRSNADERQRLGMDSEADIVEWLRVKFIPEFREVDAAWRKSSQRYWVGTL